MSAAEPWNSLLHFVHAAIFCVHSTHNVSSIVSSFEQITKMLICQTTTRKKRFRQNSNIFAYLYQKRVHRYAYLVHNKKRYIMRYVTANVCMCDRFYRLRRTDPQIEKSDFTKTTPYDKTRLFDEYACRSAWCEYVA